MSGGRTTSRGFGFQPEHSAGYHFELVLAKDGGATIHERFAASNAAPRPGRSEKAALTAHRWSLIASTVADEFNRRLRESHLRPAKWSASRTPLAPHFGKELTLLAWAIEDQDPTVIPRMVQNWRALAPEERWWFYTTINSSSATAASGIGWRAAIKIAFLDDPQNIELSTLRVTGNNLDPDDDNDARSRPSRRRSKAVKNIDPDDDSDTSRAAKPEVLQGRLFAEPDQPPYDS